MKLCLVLRERWRSDATRWAYLVAELRRGVAQRAEKPERCKINYFAAPAVNQILLTRSAARRYIDALHAEKLIISLRQLSLKLPHWYSATTLRVVKLIIWRSGRRLAANQHYTVVALKCMCVHV